MIVINLILLTRFSFVISKLVRPCEPNTQFIVKGKICTCDKHGQWAESKCLSISRKQACVPGEIIYHGCKQCICQPNMQYVCSRDKCTDESASADKAVQRLRTVMPWCTPFRSYYINCNICVCPPSGRAAEAHCARDISCFLQEEPAASDLSTKKNICIPKVMYLFPCLHCLCTDEGFFSLEKCFETCTLKSPTEGGRKCIPHTFFRNGCNVCKCPNTSIPDSTMCTTAVCNETTVLSPLSVLRNKTHQCFPHRFTKPQCHYCDCNSGTIDVNACLELDCFKPSEFIYDSLKETCSPGEMVPLCTECLCLRDGVTSNEYCSTTCSYQSKLSVLEQIVDFSKDKEIIDQKTVTRSSVGETCNANSIYLDSGRYCLCPENGNTNFNLCTPADDSLILGTTRTSPEIKIDFNMSCEPNTFIDFDCNTCFCSKKGKIDPKWCTYDDCDSKKMIQKSHNSHPIIAPEMEINDTCTPGSISQVECNFCICPESAYVEDKVCTKNDCSSLAKKVDGDKFTCEPLAYYEVDCNICYCPRDGMKNVARCTKNHCEKSFLRSDVCVPGQLFSEECNVCVCPPNGNKAERACTNNTCDDSAPWKKIFQLSESLIGNQIPEDPTRNLDLCFPGEEFQVGCKMCSCPDMGLRSYASCTPTLCEDDDIPLPTRLPIYIQPPSRTTASEEGSNDTGQVTQVLFRRVAVELCSSYNVSNDIDDSKCSPGSTYVILLSCQQCICPYKGTIMKFCRPLPKDFDCETPHENAYYLHVADRRTLEDNTTSEYTNNTLSDYTKRQKLVIPENFQHNHTIYSCSKRGKVMDECFICDCDESGSIVEEHCFKSNAENCKDTTPSFLKSASSYRL